MTKEASKVNKCGGAPLSEWVGLIFEAHRDLQAAQLSARRDKAGLEQCRLAVNAFNATVSEVLCRAVEFGENEDGAP